MIDNDLKFELIIDFDKTAKHPERIFKTISSLIEELDNFDKIICKTIPSKIEADTLLEDVEKGSIKLVLKNIVSSLDDEGIENLDFKKIAGKYLLEAKYVFLRFLENTEKNTSNPNNLSKLREDIFELSNKNDARILPVYSKVNTVDLAKNINTFNNAISGLVDKDTLKFKIANKELTVKYDKEFSIEKFEEILTKDELITNQEMFLKVRKPDYLGDSKWEFRHGKSPINAKIMDNDWLKKFQNREIDIRPKDALKCNVRIKTKYDEDNELIAALHEIIEVISVIPFKKIQQKNIFEN